MRSARKPAAIGLLPPALAVLAPVVFADPRPPWANFGINTSAFIGWGIWMAWASWRASDWAGAARAPGRGSGLPFALAFSALGVTLLAALISTSFLGWPVRVALPALATLAAAMAAVGFGCWMGMREPLHSGHARLGALDALMLMLLIGAGINGIAAWLQYAGAANWWPGLPGLGRDGRPGGLLRQPNHLGTVLVWGVIAAAWLCRRAIVPLRTSLVLIVVLLASVAVCGSRTAVLSCGVVAVWALLDRRLERTMRLLLLAAPVLVLAGWFALAAVPAAGGPSFAGAAIAAPADPTSSRGQLWQQCLRLIAEHPWLGAGFGQFNFAWTLTPMPGLPRTGSYAFSHAHNIVLHLAVEIGVPATVLVLGLVAASVVVAWRRARRAGRASEAAAILAALGVVFMHSMLEFPLWKLHFLLPACFLLGALCALAVQPPVVDAAIASTVRRGRPRAVLISFGVAMVLAGLLARQQFSAVDRLFNSLEPNGDAQRVELAQWSVLFGYMGDRMAATLRTQGDPTPSAFREVAFDGLDMNLVQAWSRALLNAGDVARGCFLLERMGEFAANRGSATPDGRCTDEQRRLSDRLTYRDFRGGD